MSDRLNRYTCDTCRAAIVTVDKDEGVTPMLIASESWCPNRCRTQSGAVGWMHSAFYEVEPFSVSTHEWYRPHMHGAPNVCDAWEIRKKWLLADPASPAPGERGKYPK